MQEVDAIQALGRGSNVDFTIDDSAPFELVEESLRAYLKVGRGLYSKGTVSVNVGRRILVPDQLAAIQQILDAETGLTVTHYWCAPEILQSALGALESGPSQVEPSFPVAANPVATNGAGRELDELQPATGPAVLAARLDTGEDTGQKETAATGPAPEDGPEDDAGLADAASDVREEEPDRPLIPPAADSAPSPDCGSPVDSSTELPEGWDGLQLLAPELDAPVKELAESAAPGIDPDSGEALPETNEAAAIEPEPATAPESEGHQNDDPGHIGLRRANEALILKTTCRSGEVIQYPGDVVVFGDVNPGAEVVADGDIVVLGSLRGMARAGAGGDTRATILALNLESHRLQIGACIGEAPSEIRRSKPGSRAVVPSIAYLRRGSIFVVPFARRREEYQGGIPYEG